MYDDFLSPIFTSIRIEQRCEKRSSLPFEDVDRILIRFESDFSIKEVFEDTGIPLEAIKKVDYYYKASKYARTVPLIPYI